MSRAGFAVVDGGVLPTAAAAILIPREGFSGGAVISASHNPAEFNGIKLFDSRGRKLDEKTEDRIEAGARGTDPLPARSAAHSTRAERASSSDLRARARRDYLDFIRKTAPGLNLKGLTVAVDAGNGAASSVAPELFRSLGATVVVRFNSPDGRNINRDCGALHPEAIARTVLKAKADLGVAFDGDADRAMFVDEKGVVRDGEAALLAAARRLKDEGRLKEDVVVSTVMANLGFRRALAALGIRMVETPVGDRHVADALERTGGVLGGEPSGHVIFREFLGTGDGLLTAVQLLDVMKRAGRPLSALAALAVKLPQILINVPVRERRPIGEMKGFSRELRRVEARFDGTGRVLVRYSGTEPLLRIMVEGASAAAVETAARSLARAAKH